MMSKVVSLEDYKTKKPKTIEENNKLKLFDIHKKILDLHEKSVINYEEYKKLLNKLNQVVNNKGEKDE
jgi:hypothetical protein